jgi:hypothetical protein
LQHNDFYVLVAQQGVCRVLKRAAGAKAVNPALHRIGRRIRFLAVGSVTRLILSAKTGYLVATGLTVTALCRAYEELLAKILRSALRAQSYFIQSERNP